MADMNHTTFLVAGMGYRKEAVNAANLQAEDELRLVPEPTNPYDNQAIAIFKGEHQIGYVPKTHNWILLRAVQESRATATIHFASPMERLCEVIVHVRHPDESTPKSPAVS